MLDLTVGWGLWRVTDRWPEDQFRFNRSHAAPSHPHLVSHPRVTQDNNGALKGPCWPRHHSRAMQCMSIAAGGLFRHRQGKPSKRAERGNRL